MTMRSSIDSPNDMYSRENELEYAEAQLLSILFICGYTETDLDVVTIDELVDAIEQMFYPLPHYLDEEQSENAESFHVYGAAALGRRQQDLLHFTLRRFWRQRHMAKW